MTKNNIMLLAKSLLNVITSVLAFVIAVLTIWLPNSTANDKLNQAINFLNNLGSNIELE